MKSIHRHVVLVGVFLALVAPVASSRSADVAITPRYTLTDLSILPGLGTVPGAGVPFAEGLNDAGQVVGSSRYWMDGSPSELLRSVAFVWSAESGTQDLGTLPDGSSSEAFDINEAGQVVGGVGKDYGEYHAFVWTAERGIQDLGTLPGTTGSAAYAINNAGQVVGRSYVGSVLYENHAFMWSAERGMQDLGTLLDGKFSRAYDINDVGKVVGSADTQVVRFDLLGPLNEASEHAFVWTAESGMQDLGTLPGGTRSTAHAINNAGQVVGEATIGPTGPRLFSYPIHAFMWTAESGMQDLGTLPGSTRSTASDINDAGQVVGKSYGNLERAFLFSDGVMTDLNSLIAPGMDVQLTEARAINNAGQILAYDYSSYQSNNEIGVFLLTPVTITLSTTSVDLGSQILGAPSVAGSVMLTNRSSAPLAITDITLTGAHTTDFAITTTCGTSLAGGASCSIVVTFTPTATGNRSATLTILSDTSGPHEILLTGMGQAAKVFLPHLLR